MTTASSAKKDTQKLQRAIVDGLEDVKAQDVAVYDTEHLSALFERVIIASGTSNRQTKALAASVIDAVRDAGFPKPRVEGEANGEWIIVDCGQAVVHIMQPNFRQYYHLEELWGEKPVRMKLGAAKPAAPKEVSKPAGKAAAPAKENGSLKRSNAAKKGVAEAFPSNRQLKEAAAKTARAAGKRAPAKKAAGTAAQPKVRTVVVQSGVRATSAKTATKASPKGGTAAASRPAARKPVAKKAPARKA